MERTARFASSNFTSPRKTLAGRIPVTARGRYKDSVECPGQLGTLASAATTANGASASSICPDWRYTLPSAARRCCSMTTDFVAEWREAQEAP